MSAPSPVLFVSHGAPTLAIADVPARRFLADYGARMPRPAAIAVVSAHWETPRPRIGSATEPSTIYDFGGFPEELYRLRHDAPGAPDWAAEATAALTAGGLPAEMDERRGRDHGAWVPLMLLDPAARIPAFQVSVQPHLGPAHMERVGHLLAPLRRKGVMILASGSITHNLRALHWNAADGEEDESARAFADWIDDAVARDDRAALRDYRRRAPDAAFHHPTEEHLLPLFAALGAAEAGKGRRVHASATFGNLAMDAYEFP